jgi:DNA-binding CsgD family transcriptional regulator
VQVAEDHVRRLRFQVIADQLNTNINTVKTQVARARLSL